MGLFDNLFGDAGGDRGLSRQEAFVGILLGAGACDGHISDEERQALVTSTRRMRMFEHFTPARWTAVMDVLEKALKRDGPVKLVERCAKVLPDALRQTAFANACDLILADEIVEDEEKAFLDHLQKVLGIDGDTALNIVEVMIIKNKG